MRIYVLPRVHQVLLIFFILQIVFSSVVCENTDDWVEKGQQPGAGGQPPQSQDSTIMENMLATLGRIKAINPQVLERVVMYLPKTVTNLLYMYIWWKSQKPSFKRQYAFRVRSNSNIDPPPVEYGGEPVELGDENEAEIAIQGESNRPAPHQDWDMPQQIDEAQFQAEYLPDPILTEQYTFHAQEAGPEGPDEHEHDENIDDTPAYNNPLYPGQDDDSMGMLEHQPGGPPQPDNNAASNADDPITFSHRLPSFWLKSKPTNDYGHSTTPAASTSVNGYGSGGGYDDGSGESDTERTDKTTLMQTLIPLLRANRAPNSHYSGVNNGDSYTESSSQYIGSQEWVDNLEDSLGTYYDVLK